MRAEKALQSSRKSLILTALTQQVLDKVRVAANDSKVHLITDVRWMPWFTLQSAYQKEKLLEATQRTESQLKVLGYEVSYKLGLPGVVHFNITWG
ncbi:hypothetical protein DRO66_03790 [Candidatus Bathyarchaeota archaeon]|nr:MAG: hypothetical protein DRO66_03790 [Candidatus Bathyarchaeota archaeon]